MIIHRLSGGAVGPVLVVDFAPFSDAEPLSHVLAGLATGRTVYQADPVDTLVAWQRYADIEELAAVGAASFLAAEPGTGAAIVIGFCSAAALALRIAARLAGSRPVTVILARPTWPDAEQVRFRFAGLLETLGAPEHPCPDLNGDPSQVVSRMAFELRAAVLAVAGQDSLDDPDGPFTELLARYRAWMTFLLACHNDPGAPVTVIPGPAADLDYTTEELAGLILPQIRPAS